MPLQPTVAQIHFANILNALSGCAATFEVLASSVKTSFLEPISKTMQSLLTAVETVKRNKDDCIQLLEQLHELLYAIIRLHISSDTGTELSSKMLENLGKFTQTLHKIHTFVEAQQEKSRIKQFFRQGEMSTLLKSCHLGLAEALKAFKVENVHLLSDVAEMQKYAQETHQEVLELISALSDGTSSDGTSFVSKVLSLSQNSSRSLSLLPSEPKIFYGRESEVSAIIHLFHQDTPRIAILGGGGMGKTSLAKTVLHHLEIAARYEQHRFFVACDTTSTSLQLAALIGAHVGLKPGKNLTQLVINYFSNSPPSLLVLDNLETIWEPTESRREIEQFLALLTDVDHLALIITMRGAERPANVQWTHPFLGPLKPLSQDAARKTVIDIVDDGYSSEDIEQILSIADNMPLAVDLIAHLVDYEGLSSVLNHWKTEKTSLLSQGHNKGSNLDLSISLSLKSPRLASLPHSRDLLSLLSMLPDGLSDMELVQCKLPIDNILACKAALLRTSLAYMDDCNRLKVLVPIREYVQKMHPPMAGLVQPVLKHFNQLLEIHETYYGTISGPGIMTQIASNFANIHNMLMKGLNQDNPDLAATIYSICHFDRFSRQAGHGASEIMDKVSNQLSQSMDHRLQAHFITQFFAGYRYHTIPNPDHLVAQALDHFKQFDDPDLKCRFYDNIAAYYQYHENDTPRALHLAETGLAFSISTENHKKQSDLLATLAWIKWTAGDYSEAQVHAFEAQRLAKISADLHQEAWALRLEAVCWYALGCYSDSISLSNRARDLLVLCGMSGGSLYHSNMAILAEVYRVKSEYAEARKIYIQTLQHVSTERDTYEHAMALLNIAQIDVEICASKHGVQANIDTANSLFSAIGHSTAAIYCETIQAATDLREGNFLAANMLFLKCLKFAWEKDSQPRTYCLERLGDVSQWNPMVPISSTWTIIFLVHSLKHTQKLEIHKALQFLGDVFLAWGDQDTAISLFTVALEGFTHMDVHRSRAECMLGLGDISKQKGDMAKATELWNTARPLFERSSQAKQITCVDDRLASLIRD